MTPVLPCAVRCRPAARRTAAFTLIEILVAIGIFAVTTLLLLERRNAGVEASFYASQLLRAQEVVDDVLMRYRLNPFSVEPLPLDMSRYEPFVVTADVQQESINILPEDWRQEETWDINDPEERKKHRIILRVTVDVGFGSMLDDVKDHYHYRMSTLIRHIELRKDERPGAGAGK